MKLECKNCGIRGGSDLAFIWYGKEVGSKTVWLCPDCAPEFEDNEERDRFLTGELDPESGD